VLPQLSRHASRASTRRSCRRPATSGRLGLDEPEHAERAGAHRAGREIRGCFEAAPGNVLISADYSQVELRILAHIAGEEVLKEIFVRGEDVHTATGSVVFGKDPSELTPMDRSKSKMINYGIVYGLSDYGLADRLNIPREEAKAFIDAYLERFARWPSSSARRSSRRASRAT
jgi:DNA polymerase-1